MTENLERQIIRLVAKDRIEKPISSMSGKLKRAKSPLAKTIDLTKFEGEFVGERAYARIEKENKLKARGLRAGVDEFKEKHPEYAQILEGMIEEKRSKSETHLYFGMNDGRKLTSNDYMSVMTDLGLSEWSARGIYTELMDVSRRIGKKEMKQKEAY